MARFRVFQDTRTEVNDPSGTRSIEFKAGEVTPKNDIEGDFLVRVLVPQGLAEKIETKTDKSSAIEQEDK